MVGFMIPSDIFSSISRLVMFLLGFFPLHVMVFFSTSAKNVTTLILQNQHCMNDMSGYEMRLDFFPPCQESSVDHNSETGHVLFVPSSPPSGSPCNCLVWADDVLSVCPPVKGHPLPQHIIPACWLPDFKPTMVPFNSTCFAGNRGMLKGETNNFLIVQQNTAARKDRWIYQEN